MSEGTSYRIREEQPEDIDLIASLTTAAFKGRSYASGNEAAIVDRLRETKQLTLSLVAVSRYEVVGHIAFSPVTINGVHQEWYGLGPVSVSPGRQRQGIGSALVLEGLKWLKEAGGKGCVLLGNAAFYRRFDFDVPSGLTFNGAPPEHFMVLCLDGKALPTGRVEFDEAFSAA